MGRFYETRFGVYFDDLDMYGVLHNARYLLLFERAVGEFWKHLGWRSLDDPPTPDRYQLVRANDIEYLRPVEGIGEVRVRLWIEHLGTSSLVFRCRVMPLDEDADYAVGKRVMVRIDPETRRPAPWTDLFRQQVAPYVAGPETASA
ncbi:MAG: acyl-CoA thioesterase [Deltaproteobacteria bacterium]|nr:MAG: acyl-CoA thioesterase [Deltaproteobacteria bacterium]